MLDRFLTPDAQARHVEEHESVGVDYFVLDLARPDRLATR
jgi:hypothetical protein